MNTKKILAVFAGFLLLVIMLFILQNLSVIEVNLLFWSFEIRQFWLIISLYVAGILTGMILCWLARLQYPHGGGMHRESDD